MKSRKKERSFFVLAAVFLVSANIAIAETIYVDNRTGHDTNPGTKQKPLRTIGKAARMVNSETTTRPTVIKIAPGIYNLGETVVFTNNRPYTEKDRLVIEATILPDDPQWKPALMPIILSIENPKDPNKPDRLTETYSLKIKVSHVTIRGLKFLGNPLSDNWHACIERVGKDLDDLRVTQCVFVGDPDALNIYCPAIATGDRFVVDHCISYNCHASAVYWDGLEGIPGKGCAVTYCIVDGARICGAWTCRTAEDFEVHHNIITRCEYFWMRKPGDHQRYRIRDCILTNNRHYSGYGVASGPTGPTGPEVTFDEENVIKKGEVILEKDKKARTYLHVVPGTLGSDLGAGLFYRPMPSQKPTDENSQSEGRTHRMDVRFNMIALFVEDLPESTKFYRDVIGLKVKHTEENYVLFQHEAIDFALFVRSKLPEWLGQQPSYPTGLNGTFELSRELPSFEDVDAEFNRLVEHGARPVTGPRDMPWGQRTSVVADPDGNLIEIGSFNKGG
ncbi:MAG TPA: VOC family protein [Sedimentisphaerales bacterium]|nr:VOC family protein [Sedimentisphaerales bacterium]